jgi:hypothetical protein
MEQGNRNGGYQNISKAALTNRGLLQTSPLSPLSVHREGKDEVRLNIT